MNDSKTSKTKYITNYYEEQTSQDYPVNMYYVDLPSMFMKCVRHHWHEKIEIDLIKSGSAIFDIGDEEIICSEGDAIVINSGQIHSVSTNNAGEKTVILSILFSPDYLFDDEKSFLTIKYRNPLISNQDFSYCVFNENSPVETRSCIQSLFHQNLNKTYGYELMTKSLLCNLWISLLSALDNNSKKAKVLTLIDTARVKDAILFIHGNYAKNLTLDEIADSIHLSKSECCRCFKRATHLTPFEYLMRLRVYESARKMQLGEGNVLNDLAVSVGFNNASYYNKIFKKYLDCTPTQYRNDIKRSHRDSLNPYGISM